MKRQNDRAGNSNEQFNELCESRWVIDICGAVRSREQMGGGRVRGRGGELPSLRLGFLQLAAD